MLNSTSRDEEFTPHPSSFVQNDPSVRALNGADSSPALVLVARRRFRSTVQRRSYETTKLS